MLENFLRNIDAAVHTFLYWTWPLMFWKLKVLTTKGVVWLKNKKGRKKQFFQKIFAPFLRVEKVNPCDNGRWFKTEAGEDCFTSDWCGVTESRLELTLSQTTSEARQLLLTILHFIHFNLQLSREKKFNIFVKIQKSFLDSK